MYHTGSFIKGQSLIYNLDPRIKLAATICLSVFILWVKRLQHLLSVLPYFARRWPTAYIYGQSGKPKAAFIFYSLIFWLMPYLMKARLLSVSLVSGSLFSYTGLQQGFSWSGVSVPDCGRDFTDADHNTLPDDCGN